MLPFTGCVHSLTGHAVARSPLPFHMPRREKRRREEADVEATEAWLAEVEQSLQHQPAAVVERRTETAAPPEPTWPPTAAAFVSGLQAAAKRTPGDITAAFACCALLRLALALELGSTGWRGAVQARLDEHLRILRSQDAQFGLSARAFYSSGGANDRGGRGGLKSLKPRAALDALAFALWAAACRLRVRVPHPVRVTDAIEQALLAQPEGIDAVRDVLRLDAALAVCWGARPSATSPAIRQRGVWRRGGGALLRLQRSRWAELVVLLRRQPAAADISDGAAGARLRLTIHTWLCTGRDAGARHMAFAVPSREAIRLVCEGAEAGGSGVVELGAGNGYWAQLCSRQLAARTAVGVPPGRRERDMDAARGVLALDTAPPPAWQQRVWRSRDVSARTRVRFGSAETLGRVRQQTLLLCMPSPGEAALADDAIREFTGSRLAYVGEWGSGMTATRTFHATLRRDFELLRVLPLPAMPSTRIALHIYRRRRSQGETRGEPSGKKPSDEGRAGNEGSDGGDGGDGDMGSGPARSKSTEPAPCRCDGCGATTNLRACPWSRALLVCSEACWHAAEPRHRAVLAFTFCGAVCAERPPFGPAWEPCGWLEHGEATERQWLALAQATPQPDRLT